MHRTIGDSYGTSSGKNIYREEDAGGAFDATQVTADALNAIQEEVANVVEGEGLTLNPATETIAAMTQLNTAIDLKVAAEATIRDNNDKNNQARLASADQSTLYTSTGRANLEQAIRYLVERQGVVGQINGMEMVPTTGAQMIVKGGVCTARDNIYFSEWARMYFDFYHTVPSSSDDAARVACNGAFEWQNYPVGDYVGALANSVSWSNGTLHVFAVQNLQQDSWGICLDTDPEGSNVRATSSASGYGTKGAIVYYRRIGSIINEGGTIQPFIQRGDLFLWKDPPTKSGFSVGNNNVTSAFLTDYTPQNIETQALVALSVETDTAPAELAYWDGALGATPLTDPMRLYMDQNNVKVQIDTQLRTGLNRQFFIQRIAGSDDIFGFYRCRGYIDTRDRDKVTV